MANQSERARMDQIVSEFFAKSLHIILGSRIPTISGKGISGSSASIRASSNRWFNLELDQSEAIQDLVEPWKRGTSEPMIVDVLLQQPGAHGWSEPPSPTRSSPSSSYGRSSPLSGRHGPLRLCTNNGQAVCRPRQEMQSTKAKSMLCLRKLVSQTADGAVVERCILFVNKRSALFRLCNSECAPLVAASCMLCWKTFLVMRPGIMSFDPQPTAHETGSRTKMAY